MRSARACDPRGSGCGCARARPPRPRPGPCAPARPAPSIGVTCGRGVAQRLPVQGPACVTEQQGLTGLPARAPSTLYTSPVYPGKRATFFCSCCTEISCAHNDACTEPAHTHSARPPQISQTPFSPQRAPSCCAWWRCARRPRGATARPGCLPPPSSCGAPSRAHRGATGSPPASPAGPASGGPPPSAPPARAHQALLTQGGVCTQCQKATEPLMQESSICFASARAGRVPHAPKGKKIQRQMRQGLS